MIPLGVLAARVRWLGRATTLVSPYDAVSPIYDLVMSACFDHYTQCATLAQKVLQVPERALILDLGGGTGGVAHRFRAQGAQVCVVDRSYNLCRRALRRAVTAVTADMVYLPYRDGSVDTAIICQALHHLGGESATLDALGEAYRVLRPGGRLLILEIDPPTSVVERLHVWLEQVLFGPVHCWPREDLLLALSMQGFVSQQPDGVGDHYILLAEKAGDPAGRRRGQFERHLAGTTDLTAVAPVATGSTGSRQWTGI
jgi:ubiquinone/menaquinone biosynthesis C-methylase UbiE